MTPVATEDARATASPALLIVGEADTGKSHYGGQLLRRLQSHDGRLKMVSAPEDLTHFHTVCERLAEGLAAPHTPANEYRESQWQLQKTGQSDIFNLTWPDYGGEQIERFHIRRQIPEPWQRRIAESDGWVVLIRLGSTPLAETIFERPRAKERMQGSSPELDTHDSDEQMRDWQQSPPAAATPGANTLRLLSPQARLVELLQAMLFVRRIDASKYLLRPTLLVCLSCYDELSDAKIDGTWDRPERVLQLRMPLLSQFIASTWAPSSFAVIGLSALGKALRDDVADEDFVDNGPERQGWCILPDGTQTPDLTAPLEMSLQMIEGGHER